MYSIGVDGRVLHGPRTGTGWYTAGLLRELSRRAEIRVRLLLYSNDRRGPADASDLDGVEVSVAGAFGSRLPGLASRIGLPVGLDRLLPGCDAYLFPNYRRNPIRRGTSVTVVYDLAFRRVPTLVNPGYMKRLQRYAEDAIRNSDLILTPSAQVRHEIYEDYGRDPTSVIAVLPGPRHRESRLWVSRGMNRGCVLHVGTVEPRKDIDTLLDAHRLLPRDLAHSFPVALVGKQGWGDVAASDPTSEEQPRARWLGYVADSELTEIYRSAAVLVSTSRYEGLGLPVLEALASGLPVVCSDIPAHRELCGEASSYFPVGDVDALRLVLMDVLSSPERRRSLAARGLKRAERFSWKVSVDELLHSMSALTQG